MIEDLKAVYAYYRNRAFLKKHGCETWEEYNRRYDPDYNIKATRIKDIYHGYPYVYRFDYNQHFAYRLLHDYGPGGQRYGYHDINDWCNDNLGDKFRFDSHRVIKYNNEWVVNELGGGDYIFAAFKDEKDYTYFLLRWS